MKAARDHGAGPAKGKGAGTPPMWEGRRVLRTQRAVQSSETPQREAGSGDGGWQQSLGTSFTLRRRHKAGCGAFSTARGSQIRGDQAAGPSDPPGCCHGRRHLRGSTSVAGFMGAAGSAVGVEPCPECARDQPAQPQLPDSKVKRRRAGRCLTSGQLGAKQPKSVPAPCSSSFSSTRGSASVCNRPGPSVLLLIFENKMNKWQEGAKPSQFWRNLAPTVKSLFTKATAPRTKASSSSSKQLQGSQPQGENPWLLWVPGRSQPHAPSPGLPGGPSVSLCIPPILPSKMDPLTFSHQPRPSFPVPSKILAFNPSGFKSL